MKGIVGPAVCHDCKQRVWMARAANGKGMAWRNADGTQHRCD